MVQNAMKRIGIFGGTFDPIHCGHLVVAETARHALSLDRVLFIPAGQPPHKPAQPVTAGEHRLRMVQLAIAGNPAFVTSDLELRRSGASYTVDTLQHIRSECPDDELYFLIGADAAQSLPSWHRPWGILELAYLVAVERPGYRLDLERLQTVLGEAAARRIVRLSVPQIDISASEIRQRVRSGATIRYLVPAAVEEYLIEHKLYCEQKEEKDHKESNSGNHTGA